MGAVVSSNKAPKNSGNGSNSVVPQSPRAGLSPQVHNRQIGITVGGVITPASHILIVCDPGPDPDDAKVILIAGLQHKAGEIVCEGLICNGGWQSRERSKLAVSILNAIEVSDIPVAEGTRGIKKKPSACEYDIAGYAEVQEDGLLDGTELFYEVLRKAEPKSLTIQIQSAGTDVAMAIQKHRELFRDKVCKVSIMGGLQRESATGRWVADSAQNNAFDMDSMSAVYQFCFSERISMHVLSRDAVPNIPMAVAQDYAGTGQAALEYLSMMQESGLMALWTNVLVTGPKRPLPPRCDVKWFWLTFCGVSDSEFEACRGAAAEVPEAEKAGNITDIRQHLKGTIKAYDVVSYMTCMPRAQEWFDFPNARERVGGIDHFFFLEQDHMLAAESVVRLLRAFYDRAIPELPDSGELESDIV